MDTDKTKETREGKTIAEQVTNLAEKAKRASWQLASLSAEQRSALLNEMAEQLTIAKEAILSANAIDCERQKGVLSSAMLDRLTITEQSFCSMVEGVREIASAEDVVGEQIASWDRPSGIQIEQRRVPLGVVAVIYESRPNVTADAAAICIRSGNVALLKGGSEAIETNRAIAVALSIAAQKQSLPAEVVAFIDTTDRSAVSTLLQLEASIDVVIPRGGEALIRAVTEQSRIPVLKHYKGVCHLYVDKQAILEDAVRVVVNAKVQRPGVCNAVETILVHQNVAAEFLPKLVEAMPQVEIRGCKKTCNILSQANEATETDWSSEYLALILSVRIVESLEQAIEHINTYGSGHTDGILSQNEAALQEFSTMVDTGVVVCNASTRFNDGAEFGKGAEIGISTDKLHARGPVGASELTTYKYIVTGSGTIRE